MSGTVKDRAIAKSTDTLRILQLGMGKGARTVKSAGIVHVPDKVQLHTPNVGPQ
jgi:hypothetical protein